MDSPSFPDPRAEYQTRLRQWEQRLGRLARLDDVLSVARGMVFLAGLILAAAILMARPQAAAWLAVPAALFAALVLLHQSICDLRRRAERAVDYYTSALKRVDEQWAGEGTAGERYHDPDHPSSGDLDLFGRGSLFELLCRARTRPGEDRLAEWLRAPAEAETVWQRQAAVRELRDRVDLRERLGLLEADVHDELNPERLLAWTKESAPGVSVPARIAAVLLAMTALAALAGWAAYGLTLSAFLAVLMAEILLLFCCRKPISAARKTAEEAAAGLSLLSKVLGLIEQENFSSPLLQQVSARLTTEGLAPSRQIARVESRVRRLSNCAKNQFFAPIALVLLLPLHLVAGIARWRRRIGPHVGDWLDAVAEFEAVSSLGCSAFERPGAAFPEVVDDEVVFDAIQIGHPLLPDAECVRNDVSLGPAQRLLLVSGSNMSGKSTLLRTVGTNAVLALAGAPVRAEKLRISSLQVAASMRISDSLQDSRSLFYAALSRMKTIIELTSGPRPVLFLLDEILVGTNSHDRRLGAEAVIRSLLKRNAIGLMTTHDLELTKIVGSFDGQARNVHFEDDVIDGRMHFDYRLHDGVVRKSNALELMRMIGLDV